MINKTPILKDRGFSLMLSQDNQPTLEYGASIYLKDSAATLFGVAVPSLTLLGTVFSASKPVG